MSAHITPRLIDARGAATYLGVTESYVRAMVFDRRIPFVKIGKSLRFDITDLDQWIADNRTEAG